ncbi:MAG: hypothetical protein IPI88_04455 [Chitinophagaceae bacterium]|nr:hypothetical protein [Chitinophagaceae bacterium]
MEDKRKNGGFSKLTVDDLEKVSPGCKDWLRVVKIISVIERIKWALDIAIYEYEWHEIVEAVNEASKRGVNIRLLYHAKKGDKQTKENKENAGLLIKAGQAKERITSSIFHDKFIVLSKVTKTG